MYTNKRTEEVLYNFDFNWLRILVIIFMNSFFCFSWPILYVLLPGRDWIAKAIIQHREKQKLYDSFLFFFFFFSLLLLCYFHFIECVAYQDIPGQGDSLWTYTELKWENNVFATNYRRAHTDMQAHTCKEIFVHHSS